MNHYSWFDHDQFCIALGYKGGMIKDYFRAHHGPNENVSLDYNKQSVSWRSDCHRDWKLNFLETGLETKTGGRIKRLKEFVGNETFLLTWGDAVADIDLNSLIDFHRSHGKLATLTAVRPPARFGRLTLLGDRVSDFAEKQNHPDDWISGAYFVLEPEVFSYIDGDSILDEAGNSLAGRGTGNGDFEFEGNIAQLEEVLLSIDRFLADGSPVLRVAGPAATQLVLSWSPDLTEGSWEDLTQLTLGATPTEYNDDRVSLGSRGFYRVRVVE